MLGRWCTVLRRQYRVHSIRYRISRLKRRSRRWIRRIVRLIKVVLGFRRLTEREVTEIGGGVDFIYELYDLVSWSDAYWTGQEIFEVNIVRIHELARRSFQASKVYYLLV